MKKHLLLLYLISAIVSCLAAAAPNIVLIYTDDQDYDQIGAFGSNIPTPNIDQLAADGVKLTRYYPATALCAPSRWALQNGIYASAAPATMRESPAGSTVSFQQELGDEENRGPEAWTLPTTLKKAGYQTGFVGKYHLGFMGERIKPKKFKDAPADDPGMREELFHNFKLAQQGAHAGGYDFADGLYHDNAQPDNFYKSVQYHNQDWITWNALRFLDQQTSKQPFFLIMNSTIPHWPKPEDSLKVDQSITPIGVVDFPHVQPSRQSVLERAAKIQSKDEYAAGIIWLDDAVGVLVQKLKDMGAYENTLIFYISDHSTRGKWTCDYGRTPAIVHWPAHIPAGSSTSELVQNVDIAPTIFEAAGIALDPEIKLQGVSALKVLTEGQKAKRDHAYMEILYQRAVISDDNFKYLAVRFPKETQALFDAGVPITVEGKPLDSYAHAAKKKAAIKDALYNLNIDPDEKNNLAADPAYAETLTRMKALMAKQCEALPHAFGEFN